MTLGKRYSTVFPLGQGNRQAGSWCFQYCVSKWYHSAPMQLWLPKHDFICNLGDSEAVTCQKKDKLRCVWTFWKMIPFYCSFSSNLTIRFSAEASSPAESAEGSQWLQHGRSESSSIVRGSGGKGAQMMCKKCERWDVARQVEFVKEFKKWSGLHGFFSSLSW